jgi:1,4-dihydroxy-2-naphthoate polyprenyltransferase
VSEIAVQHSLTPARLWWNATRPATLTASVSPVLAGTAAAAHEQGARLWPAVGALLVALCMQLGVNYANDYSDYRRGADTPARLGPPRAASSGLVPPGQVRLAALAAFGAAAAIGLVLSLATDWRLIAVGGACILAGWLYTGGPVPYGYFGLGEVFAFTFFGLVAATGTAYVQELRLSWTAVLAGVATGLFAVAILALNNLRDLDSDRGAGKVTLAVRMGRPPVRALIAAALAGAFLVPVVAFGFRLADWPVLLPLLASPLALRPLRLSANVGGGPLVRALKSVAQLELVFALLWTAGLLWR